MGTLEPLARRADGQVKACFVGANIPAETKADLGETPNEGMVAFGKENPDAEVVPPAAAGRATVLYLGLRRRRARERRTGAACRCPGLHCRVLVRHRTTHKRRRNRSSLRARPGQALPRLKSVTVAPYGRQPASWSRELQMCSTSSCRRPGMDAAYWAGRSRRASAYLPVAWTPKQSRPSRLHLMMDANYGRWDRFDDFAVFWAATPRPLGSYVYPADLTKAELDAHIAAHPDAKGTLLSPYTVVRRDGDMLVAIPTTRVYAAYVEPAAALLEEAAGLSQNRVAHRLP